MTRCDFLHVVGLRRAGPRLLTRGGRVSDGFSARDFGGSIALARLIIRIVGLRRFCQCPAAGSAHRQRPGSRLGMSSRLPRSMQHRWVPLSPWSKTQLHFPPEGGDLTVFAAASLDRRVRGDRARAGSSDPQSLDHVQLRRITSTRDATGGRRPGRCFRLRKHRPDGSGHRGGSRRRCTGCHSFITVWLS